jgi:hypothetical protein
MNIDYMKAIEISFPDSLCMHWQGHVIRKVAKSSKASIFLCIVVIVSGAFPPGSVLNLQCAKWQPQHGSEKLQRLYATLIKSFAVT